MQMPMKVWRPDGSTVKAMSIASDADHFGNLVAEGHLDQSEYWPSMARSARADATRSHEMWRRLKRKIEQERFEATFPQRWLADIEDLK